MHNKMLRNIHRIGSVGSQIVRICKILLILAMILVFLCFVKTLFMPENAVAVKIDGNAVVNINLDDFTNDGVKIMHINESAMEQFIKDNTTSIPYSDTSMDVEQVSMEGHMASILANGNLSEGNLRDFSWVLLTFLIYLALILMTVCFASRLVNAFRFCDSPFEQTIIKKMKQFAYSLIPWIFLSCIINNIMKSFFTPGPVNIRLSVNLAAVIAIAAILALTYIFQYGARLESESGENP